MIPLSRDMPCPHCEHCGHRFTACDRCPCPAHDPADSIEP